MTADKIMGYELKYLKKMDIYTAAIRTEKCNSVA